jgi:hypothetical protein
LAAVWWPEELKEKNEKASVIPTLLKTQDQFISILRLCHDRPEQIFDLIQAAKFPANLFLKHLVVLADYGGETISRLNKNFQSVFSEKNSQGKYVMRFFWKGKEYQYVFKELPANKLSSANKALGIDQKGLTKDEELDNLKRDVIMILLYGASSKADGASSEADGTNLEKCDLEKCEIGSLLGTEEELNKYVKQKYITISRITQGAAANELGQIAQSIVFDFLEKYLGEGYSVRKNGRIVLDGYQKQGGMPFDIVVEKGNKVVGIEVSFQVTTNSTIERKSGQAADRKALMHKQGYKIAYVIDGAGNFQRSSATSTICQHSDCTVAYRENEFEVLGNFIRDFLG